MFPSVVLLMCAVAASPVSRADGLDAWDKVYSVLTNPRCINCHTAKKFKFPGCRGWRTFR